MRRFQLVALILITTGVSIAAETSKEFESATARMAKRKYEDSVEKAAAEFQRARKTAAATYLSELEPVLRAETVAGHLEEAKRIDRVIKSLQNDRTRSWIVLLPQGIWEVRFSNAITRVYRFEGNKVSYREDGKENGVGRVWIEDGQVYVQTVGDTIERFTQVGEKMYVESFSPVKRLETDSPSVLAVGRPRYEY